MRSLPWNAAGVATSPKWSLSSFVAACCVGVMLLLAASIPSHAGEPQVEVSKRAASLPGPHYKWFPMPKVLPGESDPRVLDEKFRSQLQGAFDKALAAKGYRPAAAGAQPDFVIAYRVGVRDVTQTTVRDEPESAMPQSSIQCGLGGCSQIVTTSDTGTQALKLDTKASTEGGLLVEVLEPGTVRVLWRALNRGTVKPGAVSQKRLDAVAKDTLAQLPPAAGR
jgi:hypothetical protein